MTEDKCENCRFFQKGGRDGHCRNIEHAKIEWVGGGGEYSSSAQTFVPATVWATQWCELHEPARPKVTIRPVTQEEHQARWEEERAMYRGLTTETSPPTQSLSYVGTLLSGKKSLL